MPSSHPLPSGRDVLRVPAVRGLLGANVLLHGSSMLYLTAVAKLVFDRTDSELALGFLGLAEFAPIALLALVAGAVSDRWNRARIGAMAVAAETVAALGSMLYARSGSTSMLVPVFVAGGFGVGRAFAAPNIRSLPAMVAPPGALPRVIGLSAVVFTTATVAGPAAAGFLYAAGPQWPFVCTIAANVAAITLLLRVELPARDPTVRRPPASLHSALEGLAFIRRTPILLAAISLDLFAVLFGGAVALLPVIATERLGVGDVAYGWLRAANGIGAALTAIVLATHPVRRHVGRVLLIAVAAFGIGTIVLGATRSYAVAFVALLVLSGADMVSMFIRSTIAPLVTPDDRRGRVLAVENVFIGASNELGSFESGFAASLVGTPTTVVGGGVATLVVTAVWAVRFPSLRRIDRFSELDAHAKAAATAAAEARDEQRGRVGT